MVSPHFGGFPNGSASWLFVDSVKVHLKAFRTCIIKHWQLYPNLSEPVCLVPIPKSGYLWGWQLAQTGKWMRWVLLKLCPLILTLLLACTPLQPSCRCLLILLAGLELQNIWDFRHQIVRSLQFTFIFKCVHWISCNVWTFDFSYIYYIWSFPIKKWAPFWTLDPW